MKISFLTLLNIILVTVLVTSTFFTSIRSVSESVKSGTDSYETALQLKEYDPWIDVNDDGVIDVSDLVIMVGSIPSKGDPTKTVIIAGCNWSQFTYDFWLAPFEEGNVTVLTAGYRQITLGFTRSPREWPHFGNVTVATGFLIGELQRYLYVDRFNVTAGWTGSQLPILVEYPVVRTYDIKGPLLTIAFYNPNNDMDMHLWIVGYMTT